MLDTTHTPNEGAGPRVAGADAAGSPGAAATGARDRLATPSPELAATGSPGAPTALPPLDRRGFLRGLAGGGAAVAVAAWLPAGGPAYPPPRQELAALTAKEFAVVRAAAEALLADVPAEPEAVARAVDRDLALMGEPILTDMKTVLGLLEHLTLLGGRTRRFTQLESAARLRYLNGWGTSRFNLRRASFHAVRTLVHFYGWSEESMRPVTGYRGTWPERFDYPAYPVDFGGVG